MPISANPSVNEPVLMRNCHTKPPGLSVDTSNLKPLTRFRVGLKASGRPGGLLL